MTTLDQTFSLDRLSALIDQAQSAQEVEALRALWQQARADALAAVLKDFSTGSLELLALSSNVAGHVRRLQASAGIRHTPALDGLLAAFADVRREFHETEGLKKAHERPDDATDVVNDEREIAPTPEPRPLPPPPPARPVLTAPTPLNSRRFEALADEYVTFFLGAAIHENRQAEVSALVQRAIENERVYRDVGDPLGIPWWFIAAIHLLESGYNFSTHLHNGDPLSGRTVRIPPGRPPAGAPPFSWPDSARDALTLQKLDGLADWSLPRALWRWERYNGLGYRFRGVPTPYLWSYSSIYQRGRFVRDGVFDPQSVAQQCGAAVFLKELHRLDRVALDIDQVEEDATDEAESGGDRAAAPPPDAALPPGHDFAAFFATHLAGVQHFTWQELLFKGAQHAVNGLNTDPPRDLWPNVVPLVRVLDAFREAIGLTVRLTSVYRSPAYNASISGSARRSQHMAFRAADLIVVGAGAGPTGAWADRLKALRQQGMFEGGIGVYDRFVHVDVRGTRADWDNRT